MLSHRLSIFRSASLAASFLLAVALTPLSFAQGSLTPPGAPAPTMKSLGELDASLASLTAKSESRIPIDTLPGDATASHIISTPGSYYLRSNLVAVANNVAAIRVASSGVLIDLNGFSLTGTGSLSTATAIDGIALTPRRVIVRNGTITGWSSGIRGPFTALVSDLVVEDCIRSAIELNLEAVVRNVEAYNVGTLGILAGTVESCRVRTVNNAAGGATGIWGSTVRGCEVNGVTATGSGIAYGILANTVVDCRVVNVFSASGVWGIDAAQASQGVVRGCIVDGISNSATVGATYGISAMLVTDCLVKTLQGSNDALSGITAVSVDRCVVQSLALTNAASAIVGIDADTVSGSRVDGISGSTSVTYGIKAMVATGNTVNFLITSTGSAYGIQLTQGGQARDNSISSIRSAGIYAPLSQVIIAGNSIRNVGSDSGVTTGAGILVASTGARIENNAIGGGGGCDYGIRVTATQNFILGNRCSGSFTGAATGAGGVDTAEFNLATGNRFGVIVGTFAGTGEITATNPFANFSD